MTKLSGRHKVIFQRTQRYHLEQQYGSIVRLPGFGAAYGTCVATLVNIYVKKKIKGPSCLTMDKIILISII